MSIQKKLIYLPFLIILIITILLFVFLNPIISTINTHIKVSHPKIEAIYEIEININEAMNALFIDSLSPENYEDSKNSFDDAKSDLYNFFKKYKESNTVKKNLTLINQIEKKLKSFFLKGEDILKLHNEQFNLIIKRRDLLNKNIEVYLDDQLQPLLKDSKNINIANEIEINMHELISGVRGYLLKNDKLLKHRVADSIQDLDFWINEYEKVFKTPKEEEILKKIKLDILKIKEQSLQIIKIEDKRRLIFYDLEKVQKDLDEILDEYIQRYEKEHLVDEILQIEGNINIFIKAIIFLMVLLIFSLYINIKPIVLIINKLRKSTENFITTFTIDLPKSSNDELGKLSNDIKLMMNEIICKTNDLQELNEQLEIQVKKRTKELAELNKNLENQVSTQVEELRQKDLLLLEQSKLASMGEMIGNIAHQWRQPLSSISSITTSLKLLKSLKQLDDQEFHKGMDKINNKVHYLSEIIDIFRDFLKTNKEYKKVIIEDVIDELLIFIDDTLKNNNIMLINNINKNEETKYKMISSEFIQALINITNNAKDAIIERKIQTPWIKLDLIKKEEFILLTIEDNAGGISKKDLSHIFEPYYTTKHKSQGTGLGLNITYRIITKSLKGKIYVKNTNNGAKFNIELPL